jgi:hypothetical protein
MPIGYQSWHRFSLSPSRIHPEHEIHAQRAIMTQQNAWRMGRIMLATAYRDIRL